MEKKKKEVTCRSGLFVSLLAPLWITQRPSVFLAVFGTWGACWKPGQPTFACLTLQHVSSALVFQSCLCNPPTPSLSLSLSLFLAVSLSHSLAAVSPLVCGQHINGNIKRLQGLTKRHIHNSNLTLYCTPFDPTITHTHA